MAFVGDRVQRVADVQPARRVLRRRAVYRGLHPGAHEAAPLFERRALLSRRHELDRLSEIAGDGDLQRAFFRDFPDRRRQDRSARRSSRGLTVPVTGRGSGPAPCRKQESQEIRSARLCQSLLISSCHCLS